MHSEKEKISSQADSVKWNALKQLAKQERRNIDSLLDEALTEYLDKKQVIYPRNFVIEAYNSSHNKYSQLYKLLAE